MNHDVFCIETKGKIKKNQINEDMIKKHNPNIVWLLSPFYVQNEVISKCTISYLKQKQIPIVCYSTFNTQIPYNKQDDLWKVFDFFFAQNIDFYNHLRKINVNAYYIPLGFYPDQYYYIQETTKKIQISFSGNPQTTVETEYDKRTNYLKSLNDFNIKIYGKRFSERGLNAISYNTHKEENNIYNISKINLDLPFINSSLDFYKNKYHIKNRFFEIPASNNFLLSSKYSEALNILDETMIGYYDDNVESLKYTINKYIKDEKLRLKMSKKAYSEVLNKHTFHHRFKKMLYIIGEL